MSQKTLTIYGERGWNPIDQRRQVLKWVNQHHRYAYLVASGQLKL